METIEIATAADTSVVEVREEIGRWAIHEPRTLLLHGWGPWSVTHIPSGYSFVNGITLKRARQAIRALERMGDIWDETDGHAIGERINNDDGLASDFQRILDVALTDERGRS